MKASNFYTGAGQRLRQRQWVETEDAETGEVRQEELVANYLYIGSQLAATYDDQMNPLELNVVGTEVIVNVVYDGSGAKATFLLYDARGSVTSQIDGQGNLVKGYEYDEYGNMTEKGESEVNSSLTYTGAVYDKSTGLYYMNARHYDPSTGRFLQQDTYRGNMYNPVTQHLYAYCGNNPVNMVDPSGHAPEDIDEEDLRDVFERIAQWIAASITGGIGYYAFKHNLMPAPSPTPTPTPKPSKVDDFISSEGYQPTRPTSSNANVQAYIDEIVATMDAPPTADAYNAVIELAWTWEDSRKGKYNEDQLTNALKDPMTVLTEAYGFEFGFTIETTTSSSRIVGYAHGAPGSDQVTLENYSSDTGIVSTIHTHLNTEQSANGNSGNDARMAKRCGPDNPSQYFSGNSYVVKGGTLHWTAYDELRYLVDHGKVNYSDGANAAYNHQYFSKMTPELFESAGRTDRTFGLLY